MLVIGGFNVFTSVLLMTGGGPGGQTMLCSPTCIEWRSDRRSTSASGRRWPCWPPPDRLLVSLAQMRPTRRRSMSVS